MHMIKKGQLDFVKDKTSSAADRFYSPASWGGPIQGRFHRFPAVATKPVWVNGARDGRGEVSASVMRDDAAGSATQELAKESLRGRVVGRQRIGRETRWQLDLQ